MNRGGNFFVFCSCLAIAACAAPAVKVRPIGDTSAKLGQGGGELGAAQSMLALGSVGLALEGFRKLQSEQPANPAVYAGIAQCYAAMGRFDLARANYEIALAYAPRDPALLSAFAASLDRLGQTQQAAEVRAELTQLAVASGSAQPHPTAPLAGIRQEPQLAAVPTPVPHLSSVTVELPPVRPVTPNPEPVISKPAPSPVFVQPDMHAMAALAAPPISPPHAALVEPQLAIMPQEPKRVSQPARTVTAPHLERISRGEVALVTNPGPIWRVPASRLPVNTALRWLPIQTAEGRPVIRLLNAARTEGLAARSRTALLDRGWRRIEIGDYREVRRHSLVLYSAVRASAAQRLATQFGCRAVKVRSPDVLIVLLGRDAAARKLVPRRA